MKIAPFVTGTEYDNIAAALGSDPRTERSVVGLERHRRNHRANVDISAQAIRDAGQDALGIPHRPSCSRNNKSRPISSVFFHGPDGDPKRLNRMCGKQTGKSQRIYHLF